MKYILIYVIFATTGPNGLSVNSGIREFENGKACIEAGESLMATARGARPDSVGGNLKYICAKVGE